MLQPHRAPALINTIPALSLLSLLLHQSHLFCCCITRAISSEQYLSLLIDQPNVFCSCRVTRHQQQSLLQRHLLHSSHSHFIVRTCSAAAVPALLMLFTSTPPGSSAATYCRPASSAFGGWDHVKVVLREGLPSGPRK
jgi:hypothetical protein